MATTNHTKLHDFNAVLEGQNTKNNGQRENIGNHTYEKWKSNDCCTQTGLLKTKLHQLIFVNSPTPNAILIKRGKNKNFN